MLSQEFVFLSKKSSFSPNSERSPQAIRRRSDSSSKRFSVEAILCRSDSLLKRVSSTQIALASIQYDRTRK